MQPQDTLPYKTASKSNQQYSSYRQFSLKVKGRGQVLPKCNCFWDSLQHIFPPIHIITPIKLHRFLISSFQFAPTDRHTDTDTCR